MGTLEKAIRAVAQNLPSLMVVNYRLPGAETGAQAITGLRIAVGRSIPALVITGDAAPDHLREAQTIRYRLRNPSTRGKEGS